MKLTPSHENINVVVLQIMKLTNVYYDGWIILAVVMLLGLFYLVAASTIMSAHQELDKKKKRS